jgi:hypothetical protein
MLTRWAPETVCALTFGTLKLRQIAHESAEPVDPQQACSDHCQRQIIGREKLSDP